MASNTPKPTPEQQQALAAAEAQMAVIEGANSFASMAATFRDALLQYGFSEAPAEVTALQLAAGMFNRV